jgi:uncharacterized beta-barrel protein YwiB (DUF1934 family)
MDFYIKDGKKATAFIRETCKSMRGIEARLHVAAVTCAMHAIEHGDVTMAQNFLSGLDNAGKNALRLASLKQWFISDRCPFKWGKHGGVATVVYDKVKADKLHQAYDADPEAFVQDMAEVPFYMENKEPEFKGFDLLKALNTAIARAEKMQTEHPDDARVDVTGLDDVKAIVAKLAASKVGAKIGAVCGPATALN